MKSLVGVQKWQDEGLCVNEDPDLFFPVGKSEGAKLQVQKAKAICYNCKVIRQCLEQALTSGQDIGVWGGKDEDERKAITREWALIIKNKPANTDADNMNGIISIVKFDEKAVHANTADEDEANDSDILEDLKMSVAEDSEDDESSSKGFAK